MKIVILYIILYGKWNYQNIFMTKYSDMTDERLDDDISIYKSVESEYNTHALLYCSVYMHIYTNIYAHLLWTFQEQFTKSSYTDKEQCSTTAPELLLQCSRTVKVHFKKYWIWQCKIIRKLFLKKCFNSTVEQLLSSWITSTTKQPRFYSSMVFKYSC